MSRENQEVASKLIKITLLSLLFMTVEFIGGYLAHSIAIWSDAFHLLSDVIAYVISIIAVLLSDKKSPRFLTFGWAKSQTLGALLNIAFIYIVTIELFIEATHRMIRKDKVQEPKYMLLTSIFGLICNFFILNILHNDPNVRHHGCSHDLHDHGNHFHLDQNQHKNDQHDGKPCNGQHLLLDQIKKAHFDVKSIQNKNPYSHVHNKQYHLQEQNHDHREHTYEHHRNLSQKEQHYHVKGNCCRSPKNEKETAESLISISGLKAVKKTLSMQDSLLSSHQSDQEIKSYHPNKQNINLQAAYIHIITDIILSIGVIIAALFIYFFAPQDTQWSSWYLADPLCTYLFSVLAVYSTWPILKQSLIILLDGCDNPQLVEELRQELNKMQQVKQVLDLKIWSLNRGKYSASVRVRMQKGVGNRCVRRLFTLRDIECFVDAQQQQLFIKE